MGGGAPGGGGGGGVGAEWGWPQNLSPPPPIYALLFSPEKCYNNLVYLKTVTVLKR